MDDTEFFEQQFKEHKGLIRRVIMRYFKNEQTVDDVLQMTFIKAWVSRKQFGGKSKYSTWLCTIAIRTSINHLIATKRRILDSSLNIDSVKHFSEITSNEREFLNPADLIEYDQGFDEICANINKLPSTMRDTVVLNFIYGLSYPEIAKATNCPVPTVKTRIFRARALLKKMLYKK